MITEEEISNQNNNIFDLSHPNARLAQCLNSVLNVKAVVAAFNQEKALVGAFSVITNLRMELFEALGASAAPAQARAAPKRSSRQAENDSASQLIPRQMER